MYCTVSVQNPHPPSDNKETLEHSANTSIHRFATEKDTLVHANDDNNTNTTTDPTTKVPDVCPRESNDPKNVTSTAAGRQVPNTADNMANERPAKPNPTRGGEKEGDLTLYSPIG